MSKHNCIFRMSEFRPRPLTVAGITAGVLLGLTITWASQQSVSPPISDLKFEAAKKQFDLSYFAGVWRIEGEVLLDANSSVVKVSGAAHSKWNDGRTALDESSVMNFPDGKRKINVSYLSYIEDKDQLLLKTPPEVGAKPLETTAKVTGDGKEFEFVDSSSKDGTTRLKVTIIGPSEYVATVNYTPENGEKIETAKLRYSRVKA